MVITSKNKTIESVQTNFPEKYIATIYQKVKSKSFKKQFRKNCVITLCMEIFDIKFVTFESKREELVETSLVRCSKQIDHLQIELKTKGKMIRQFLILLSNLANSELENLYIN